MYLCTRLGKRSKSRPRHLPTYKRYLTRIRECERLDLVFFHIVLGALL